MDSSTEGRELRTGAITRYDGIFKSLHDEAALRHFLRARRLLAEGLWEEALQALQEARGRALEAHSEDDLRVLEVVVEELHTCRAGRIAPGLQAVTVDWAQVWQRPVQRLAEPHDRLPQALFFLTWGDAGQGRRLLGRKALSDSWLQNRIPELFCSRVEARMLLGEVADLRVTEREVVLYYRPLQDGEKLQVFQDVVTADGAGAELVFPFPLLTASGKAELTSPSEGWQVDSAYDDMLSHGEEELRAYTCQLLRPLGLRAPRLYDPACSTGVFLASLKAVVPDAVTIGQDLSRPMTEVARLRLDEVHHGNALRPSVLPLSAQAVFIRFLNSEVVTSAEAEALLPGLLETVAVGGLCVIFGHTPVLLSAAQLRAATHFHLLRCVGVHAGSIFQYYVLRRTGA